MELVGTARDGRWETGVSGKAPTLGLPAPCGHFKHWGCVCWLYGQQSQSVSAFSPCWQPGRPGCASHLTAVLLLFLPP